MKKYLSYSEYRKWLYDRDEWYAHYVEGEEFVPNKAMILGSIFHNAMESQRYGWREEMKTGKEYGEVFPYQQRRILGRAIDTMYLSGKRSEFPEIKTFANAGEFKLYGIFDGFDEENRILTEYKTADKSDSWTQWRVDHDIQLSWYAWMYWLNKRKYLREIRLHRINTKKGTVKTFHTTRSFTDIKTVQDAVTSFVDRLKSDGTWHKRLSTEERRQRNINERR